MGNLIQQILGILTHPLGLVVIFGLIGAIGKFGNWLSQERARRGAIQARTRQQNEALRTGRPVGVTNQVEPSSSASATPSASAEAEAEARSLQEQRAAQLRALQQKRLAELRAKRMQQSGGSTQTPSSSPPPPPQGARAQTARPQPARDGQRSGRQPDQGTQSPARPSAGGPAARSASTFPVPPVARRRETPASGREAFPQAAPAPHRAPPPAPPSPRAPVTASGAGIGLGALLASQADLRRAVMLSEVLGPPVSERDPDQTGMF